LALAAALPLIPARAAAQTPACCTITAIDAATRLVSGKVTANASVFQFTVANARTLATLRVGQGVFANFITRQVSLDGRSACCAITSVRAAVPVTRPAPAAPPPVPPPPPPPPAAPNPAVAAVRQLASPDLVALILYIPPINLGGGPPPPPGPQGGREAEATVMLSGSATGSGALIALSSGNTALLHVPATVTVPAGANSVKFRYDPLPVTEPTTATVSAAYSGQTKTASVLILPPPLEAVTLDSQELTGGQGISGLVKLSGIGPTDKDIRVALSSNHPAVSVPGEVLLRGVQQQAFPVTTKGVAQQAQVVVAASSAGRRREATLTLLPGRLRTVGYYQTYSGTPQWYGDMTCYQEDQPGGFIYKGDFPLAVRLTGPAPFDGNAVIKVTSSNFALLPVPATLTIPANATQTETSLPCPKTASVSKVMITGSYLGETRGYTVTVTPLRLPDLGVTAVLKDAAGNVIQRPTNPQPFAVCAKVVAYAAYGVIGTKLRLGYQHSRGFSQQLEYTIDFSQNQEICRTIEGLEIGEYVDITLKVDPALQETNVSNNTLTLHITR
jgi:hypothetical protein